MWPRFLAVLTQYGCSPWENTCCISEYCPSKALPKCFRHRQCVELIYILTRSLVAWDLFEKMISVKMDLRYSQLQNVWTSFILVCLPLPPFDWLTWKPDKCGTLLCHSFFFLEGSFEETGEAIQSIELVFSAVIREFKHSTSLQDDTSLNSLSTHHLPTVSRDFMTSSSFINVHHLCVSYHAALEPLVTFFYMLLCLLILYP